MITTEERGQREQERRQEERVKCILLPPLALRLAVQLGKCIYREGRRRLGYAHVVEQYMSRKYWKFGNCFRFYFESEKGLNSVSTVKLYSEKFPDGADYCYYLIERDYWWDKNGAHYLDNYMCLWYQKEMWEAYVPFFGEAFGKGQYTMSGGTVLMPDWQDYGPGTGLGGYLSTAENFSIALDVKDDFTESEETIETPRKRIVERSQGLRLYISYVDQDENEIAYNRVGVNTYSIE